MYVHSIWSSELADREVCGLGGLGHPAELGFLPHVVSSCDLRKIHPWLLSQARPGGPRVWCGPLGVRAQAHPAPFLSLALLQPLLFRCFFPPSPTVRPENSLALLRPRCSCAVPGLGHHSSRPTGEGEILCSAPYNLKQGLTWGHAFHHRHRFPDPCPCSLVLDWNEPSPVFHPQASWNMGGTGQPSPAWWDPRPCPSVRTSTSTTRRGRTWMRSFSSTS